MEELERFHLLPIPLITPDLVKTRFVGVARRRVHFSVSTFNTTPTTQF